MKTNVELGCGRSFGGDVLICSSHDAQVPTKSSVARNPAKKANRQGYLNLQHINTLDQEGNGATAGGCRSGRSGGDEDESEEGTGVIGDDTTSYRLAIFGLLNLSYVVLQLAGAMIFGSLALLSDGFHNLSDVGAIGMAMYIHKLQRRRCPANQEGGSDELPYGYKRAEVIGGMINSVALISLSAYIILHAVPRLLYPTEVVSGWSFILLALGGVFVNLMGVLFFLTAGKDGDGNCHHGGGLLHAHSHDHDHGHEGKYRPVSSTERLKLRDPYDVMSNTCSSTPDEDDEMVSVDFAINRHDETGREVFFSGVEGMEAGLNEEGSWSECERRKDRVRLHNNVHLGANGHSHITANGHAARDCEIEMLGHLSTATKRRGAAVADGAAECNGDEHGAQGHAHRNSEGCSHDHGHPNEHGRAHDHGHVNGHGDSNGHSHDHGHGVGDEDGCSGGHRRPGKSMNLWAVLVHSISDAISSGLVCAQGIVIYFLGYPDRLDWTDYLDPITSIMLSLFIVYFAVPVVMECSHIILEGTPRGVDLPSLKEEIMKVRGVTSIRRLSVIRLNSEEPFVGAVTLVVKGTEGDGVPHPEAIDGGVHNEGRAGKTLSTAVVDSVKRILAKYNVGQSTVEINMAIAPRFPQNKGHSVAPLQTSAVHHGGRDFDIASSTVETSGGARGERASGCASRRNMKHSLETGERARDHGGHSHDHGHCSGHGHSHEHRSEE